MSFDFDGCSTNERGLGRGMRGMRDLSGRSERNVFFASQLNEWMNVLAVLNSTCFALVL